MDYWNVSTSNALWLCVNPHLKRFDLRLCQKLKSHVDIKFWSYHQTADEPCSIQTALSLLHDYIQTKSEPIHLLGHGLSGVLGLMYARHNPQAIQSLTLLSVGANPSIGWHAHYYRMRELLPCCREAILFQMATMIFGSMGHDQTVQMASLLARVLDTELTPHSLAHQNGFPSGGVELPLLICHGGYDTIIDPNNHAQWSPYLKPGDRLWSCPQGRHFFHFDHPYRTSEIVLDFWQHLPSAPFKSRPPAYNQRTKAQLYKEINNSALLPGD